MLASLAVLCDGLAAGPVSVAAGKTLVGTSKGSVSKPSTLYYAGADFRLPGLSYTAVGLRWRDWGRRVARATGRLRVCASMAPCRRYRVKVVAGGLVRRAEGTPTNVYSRVSFTPRSRRRPLVKLCVYAEACRLGTVR